MFKENDLLLDRTGKFKQQFIEYLRQEKFAQGDIIPPRNVLAETFNVSSSTVARVVNALSRDKILLTRKGRFGGTYLLNQPKLPGEFKKIRFQFSSRPEKKLRAGLFRRWLDLFERENPGFQAEIIPQVFHFQQMEAMSHEFVSLHEHELPSILLIPLSSVQGMASRKLIFPLIASAAEAGLETEKFLPEVRSSLIFNGALYGYLTEGIAKSVLLYSKKRLVNCGLTENDLSTDYAHWLNVMKKLGNSNGGLLVENQGSGVFLLFIHLLKAFLSNNWIVNLNDWNGIMSSKECYYALEEMQSLEKTIGLNVSDSPNQWHNLKQMTDGHTAAIMTVTSLVKNHYSFVRKPEELIIAPFPSIKSNSPCVLGNTMAWVLANESDREPALAFLRWAVTGEAWQQHWYAQAETNYDNKFLISPLVQEHSESTSYRSIEQQINNTTIDLEPPSSVDFRLSVGKLLLNWLKSGKSVHDGQEQLCGLWASWINR
jgi:hypothetical protein